MRFHEYSQIQTVLFLNDINTFLFLIAEMARYAIIKIAQIYSAKKQRVKHIMRFVTFKFNGREKTGILSDDRISVISSEGLYPNLTMTNLIKGFNNALAYEITKLKNSDDQIPLNKIELLSPIPNPPRGVICLGKNYMDHIREVAKAIDRESIVPKYPIYFSKIVDRCPGHNGNIPSHKELTDSLDYEAELAVIIGKEGRNIPAEEADDYIFGYTILNDVSVRDAQRRHSQWFKGKSFDGSCPIGPWIVTKDEFKLPVELDIKSYVNGELRQNSNTRELIFDIPYVISDFSKGITLMPGDIIATGTPAGVGMGFDPPKYLSAGDVVECYIENIGSLINKVI